MYRCTYCKALLAQPIHHRQEFVFDRYGCKAELDYFECTECGNSELIKINDNEITDAELERITQQ